MKNLLKMSVVASMLLTASYAEDKVEVANNIKEMFEKASVGGEIRAGYVNQDNKNPNPNTDNQNSAVGGKLAIETAPLNGVSLGAAFYTTQRLESKDNNGAGSGLFDSNDDSYSILGQAYANVAVANTNFKAGRQQLDTPFADSDDIRMIPNLFEAYVLSNTDIENLTLIAAQVEKMSGVDTGIPEKFIDMTEQITGITTGSGTTMLAAIYTPIEDAEFSAWYYDVDDLTKITYLEGSYGFGITETIGATLGAQYANMSEYSINGINTNVDGRVWGVSGELGFETIGTTLMAAYNRASNDTGKVVVNGFGGGPYMTSMEENTIDSLEDAKAYVAGVGFDFGVVGVEGLAFGYTHGEFEDGLSLGNQHQEIEENDFSLEYAFSDELSGVLLYTKVDTKEDSVKNLNNDSFDRVQAYINYSF